MIAVAMRANHKNFTRYGDGILNMKENPELCSATTVDHAVVMEGYLDKGGVDDVFTFRNSWGTNWGENGYFRLHRDCLEGLGVLLYSSSQPVY